MAAIKRKYAAHYARHGEYPRPNKKEIARCQHAADEKWEAFNVLRSTVPTTRKGVVALLTYASAKEVLKMWDAGALLRTVRAAVVAVP
jgi:hypothetical protein